MRTRFVVSVAVADLISLALAMVVTSWVIFNKPLPWHASAILTGGRPVWPMLLFIALSMVITSFLTEGMSGPGVPRPTYGRMLVIWLGTLLLTASFLFLFPQAYRSRSFVPGAATLWLIPATIHRYLRRRRPWVERFVVITNEKELADDLQHDDHAEVVAVLEPGDESPIELPDRDVIIAVDLRGILSESMAQFLSSCDLAGYAVVPFSSIYEEHTGRVPLIHLAEGWEISTPLLEVARWLPGKRVVDIVLTIVTMPIWVVLGLLIAGYLRLTDGGNVIFRQERVGLNGRVFTMYKFRTMSPDAEKDGAQFAVEDDPRLITGGAFLRKSRLDEIPQMWNVLRGDMSIVGPRAEQVPFVSEFRRQIPFYDHRHMVRPGITGWAQVNFGYADDEVETVEKLTYDLYYIKHMSPVMDLRIFWKSVWTVLTAYGAR
ncbi:MAG TPA: sugar transferase [Acidimicrobiia bacterium]|nr:sugar transferase [Acidimicrobiia bacterium]